METEGQTGRQAGRWVYGRTDRSVDRETAKQRDKLTEDRQRLNRLTDIRTDGGRQADEQIDGQTDTWTDSQT